MYFQSKIKFAHFKKKPKTKQSKKTPKQKKETPQKTPPSQTLLLINSGSMWCYSIKKEVSHAGLLKTQRENARPELSKNTIYPDKEWERFIYCTQIDSYKLLSFLPGNSQLKEKHKQEKPLYFNY